MEVLPQTFSPRQVAIHLKVDVMKVLYWIREGELPAVNVAKDKSGPKRYRIEEKDFEAFKRSRSATTNWVAKARTTRTRAVGGPKVLIV